VIDGISLTVGVSFGWKAHPCAMSTQLRFNTINNYKGYYSIASHMYANYAFISVDIGDYGKNVHLILIYNLK